MNQPAENISEKLAYKFSLRDQKSETLIGILKTTDEDSVKHCFAKNDLALIKEFERDPESWSIMNCEIVANSDIYLN